MKLSKIIQILQLLPQSRKHLIWIKEQLRTVGYQQLILKNYPNPKSNDSIGIVVKSYFWACRSIKGCHCLPRSIALYQNLISAGYDVQHKFGVNNKDENLAAHAWVEYQGEPLNESVDLKNRFTVLEKSNGDCNSISIESLK
ncbi:MAG: lasso peptide biosynthesis B2 protein [Proteobacteria bacterium]|nr:lasso peptide biosynthesis B2 protein [Pseudomonadota bacterium]